MKRLYTTLMLAGALSVAAFGATASEIQAEKFLSPTDRTVTNYASKKPAFAPGATCSIKFDIRYDAMHYYPYSLSVYGKDGGVDLPVKNGTTQWFEPGTYDVVMMVLDFDRNLFAFVIEENIELSENITVTLDTSTIKNLISFETSLPDGTATRLATESEAGNVNFHAYNIYVFRDGVGMVSAISGVNQYYAPDVVGSGDMMYNIMTNDVSDRYHFVQQRLSLAADSSEYYTAFMGVDGSFDGTVTNDPATYSEAYEPVYVTTKAYDGTDEDPVQYVAMSALWDGTDVAFMTMQGYPLPTLKCRDSFMAEGSKLSERVGQAHYLYWQENGERLVGQFRKVPCAGGSFEYPLVDYTFHPVLSDWLTSRDGVSDYRVYPGHPILSVKSADLPENLVLGNNAPILRTEVATVDDGGRYGKTFNLNLIARGNLGEQRRPDYGYSMATLSHNGGEPVELEVEGEWSNAVTDFTGDYELSIYDDNVRVDDLDGFSSQTLRWSYDTEDCNPPVLQAIQLRDGDNRFTDRFEQPQGARLYVAAGDYEYSYVDSNNEDYPYFLNHESLTRPVSVTAEYRCMGEETWAPVGEAEECEGENEAGFGKIFAFSLDNVAIGEDNKWVDLRLTVTDEAGNSVSQTVSPAFHVEKSLVGISAPTASDNRLYRIGNRIAAPGSISIYSTAGALVMTANGSADISALASGTYIAVCQGSALKFIVKH